MNNNITYINNDKAPRVRGSVSFSGTPVARNRGGTGKRTTNLRVHRQLPTANCKCHHLLKEKNTLLV